MKVYNVRYNDQIGIVVAPNASKALEQYLTDTQQDKLFDAENDDIEVSTIDPTLYTESKTILMA